MTYFGGSMEKRTYGELLRQFRNRKKITVDELCSGICSKEALKKYESGERTPSPFLFTFLVERMGISPEEFSVMVTESEYDYACWKEKILDAIDDKEWDGLEELVLKAEHSSDMKNEVVKLQFYYYAKGVLEVQKNSAYKTAVECFKLAVDQSIPNIYNIERKEILLGKTEIHLIILYMYYGMYSGVISKEDGKRLFYYLEQYVSEYKMEENECMKVYPKLVCAAMKILEQELSKEEKISLCEKAIHLLRKTGTFFDIIELFQIYIPLLQERNDEKLAFYQKQYETFLEIFEMGEADTEFRIEAYPARKANHYMIHELFYAKRKEKNYSQMEISEGICEPETYSRIESGKRLPKRQKMTALAEKLDINWCYYRGELDSGAICVYRLRRQQRFASIDTRWEEVLELLTEMETLLDMNSVINRQYIGCERAYAEYRMGRVNAEETLNILERLLELTQNINLENDNMVYYSQTELEIIASMAQILKDLQRYDEAIALLETVIGQFGKSKVTYEYRWAGISFVLRVLSVLYFRVKKYKKSIDVMQYVLRISVKNRDGSNMHVMLDAIADDYENMGKGYSKVYQKLYRQMFYVSDFFGVDSSKEFVIGYYNKFEKNMKWY